MVPSLELQGRARRGEVVEECERIQRAVLRQLGLRQAPQAGSGFVGIGQRVVDIDPDIAHVRSREDQRALLDGATGDWVYRELLEGEEVEQWSQGGVLLCLLQYRAAAV